MGSPLLSAPFALEVSMSLPASIEIARGSVRLRHVIPEHTISQMFVVSALDSIPARDCMTQAQFQ
jgi:hypothetical protein